MTDEIKVLDHGFVRFVEAWGHGDDGWVPDSTLNGPYEDYEAGIIEAARQSTRGNFRGWEPHACTCDPPFIRNPDTFKHKPYCARVLNPGDAKLLKFLYENKHATPFEFAGAVIEVRAPIFVFREWHRHRTQSYNEMSARYTPLPDLYYQPTIANIESRAAAVGSNKQAAGVVSYDANLVIAWHEEVTNFYAYAERLYQQALLSGVPKELARITMPVGHYSQMRAATNLRNWLAFLTLRMDPKAQWEIRQYAHAVGLLLSSRFPRTWNLFRFETTETVTRLTS